MAIDVLYFRGRFEGVCGPLFRKMLEPISSLLTEAGVDRNNLDHVRAFDAVN